MWLTKSPVLIYVVGFVVLVFTAHLAYVFIQIHRKAIKGWNSLGLSDHVALASLFFNFVLLVLAVWALKISVEAYIDANQSGAVQVAALQAARQAIIDTGNQQKQELDSARDALASVVELAGKQKQILEANLKTSTDQLSIIREQLKRPVLEVRTRTWELGTGFHIVRLENGLQAGEAGIRVGRTQGTNQVGVPFYVRNIGEAPAINLTVSPGVPTGLAVECVEMPYTVLATNNYSYKTCERPKTVIPSIYPRPKERTMVTPDFADCVNVVGSAVAHFSVVQRTDLCEES